MLSKGSAIGDTPYEKSPYLDLAAFTPDEQNAFNMVRDQSGKYSGLLDQLVGRATRAPTSEDLQAYMDPYKDAVLDDTIRRISEQGARTQRGISDAATFTNAFGGSRQALLEAMNMSETGRNVGEASNKINSDAYNNALSSYLNQIGMGFDAVGNAQRANYVDAAALENIGRTQRENSNQQQAIYGAEFLRGQDWPFKQLQALSTASQSFPYQVLDTKEVTKTKQSPLNQILGLGMAAAGLMTGNPVLAASAGGASGLLGSAGKSFGGQAGGGGLGSLLAGLGGGSTRGYANGGSVTANPFYNDANEGSDTADTNMGGEVIRIRPDATPSFNANGALTNGPTANPFNMAPEILSPANVGGNPVARLLGMYKEGTRAGGMGNPLVGYASGGLVGGQAGEGGGFSFRDILKNPDSWIELGLSVAASEPGTPTGTAIAQSLLGLKKEHEQEGLDPLQMMRLEQMQQNMELSRQRFAETQDMNAWRRQEADSDDADRRAAREEGRSLQAMIASGINEDRDASRALREQEYLDKKNKTQKYSYPGMNNALRSADSIYEGKPLGKDAGGMPMYADEYAFDNTLGNLYDILDSAAANDDTATVNTVQGKIDRLEKDRPKILDRNKKRAQPVDPLAFFFSQ